MRSLPNWPVWNRITAELIIYLSYYFMTDFYNKYRELFYEEKFTDFKQISNHENRVSSNYNDRNKYQL